MRNSSWSWYNNGYMCGLPNNPGWKILELKLWCLNCHQFVDWLDIICSNRYNWPTLWKGKDNFQSLYFVLILIGWYYEVKRSSIIRKGRVELGSIERRKRVEAEKARGINLGWCRKILYCLLETSCGKVVLSWCYYPKKTILICVTVCPVRSKTRLSLLSCLVWKKCN